MLIHSVKCSRTHRVKTKLLGGEQIDAYTSKFSPSMEGVGALEFNLTITTLQAENFISNIPDGDEQICVDESLEVYRLTSVSSHSIVVFHEVSGVCKMMFEKANGVMLIWDRLY
eukprot:TRINITY_DN11574_c0_g1_i1.p1 TRINITY_DN11574_c0_g1~~TRINITY_DN11574_c0_g1_i1.p1  ORF type:complete len:114 (-),score=18.45 TRINITY_DN11574_c0_g1_i1:289-630(-)